MAGGADVGTGVADKVGTLVVGIEIGWVELFFTEINGSNLTRLHETPTNPMSKISPTIRFVCI
jgi:hypothetical protein